jgi:hypothetical protein
MRQTASAPSSTAGETAQYRWKLGHQVFHLYLVAMISLLDDLDDSVSSSEKRTATLLADLAELFKATSASMRYAGSFDSATYDRSIRPSMAPPVTKPGFSGLLNLEHKRMLAKLVSMPGMLKERFGKATSAWPSPVCDAWNALVDAQHEARHHHVLVCRKLVPNGPSLLRLHSVDLRAAGRQG